MTGSYAVDASRFPKVQVRFVGALTDEAFRAYLNEYGALLARGERYGIVFDATQADRPTAVQRRMQSEWIHANEPVLRRLCVGGAFAISSSLVRGAAPRRVVALHGGGVFEAPDIRYLFGPVSISQACPPTSTSSGLAPPWVEAPVSQPFVPCGSTKP